VIIKDIQNSPMFADSSYHIAMARFLAPKFHSLFLFFFFNEKFEIQTMNGYLRGTSEIFPEIFRSCISPVSDVFCWKNGMFNISKIGKQAIRDSSGQNLPLNYSIDRS